MIISSPFQYRLYFVRWFFSTRHSESNVLYFMSKLQTEPKLSRFKLYRQKPNKGNKTDVTLYTNSAVCTCRLCALPWRRNSLLSTHWFLRFLLSQLSTLITKNLKPKSKIRNDGLLSLTFLYHPAKFHRVSTPFGSSVWGELFVVFRPEQFPLFRLYYWRENPSGFLAVSGESEYQWELFFNKIW